MESDVREYEKLPAEVVQERAWAARRALGKRAVVLAHHYQTDEVVAFADYRGDSLELSRVAAEQRDSEYIVFCGVDFKAQSAAILAGAGQTVLMPAGEAPCPMASMVTAEGLAQAWDYLTGLWGVDSLVPLAYQNSSAAVKAFCGNRGGAVCTSSNAGPAIRWGLRDGRRVLFVPDQYLATNSAMALGYPRERVALWNREQRRLEATGPVENLVMVAWDGYCSVHRRFTVADVDKVRADYPGIRVIVHPECTVEVVAAADNAGSTAYIVREVEKAPAGAQFAIGTEWHLVNRLAEENPDKIVIPLRRSACATMARTDIYNLCYVLEHLVAGQPTMVTTVDPAVVAGARAALERMLEIR
ncbi:MAG: quinolinate synthase NadA [Anaerolineae bacterium]